MELKDLAVKHDYYCNMGNYYSNDPGETFKTWEDFYNEFHDADIDMNLIFRFDISLIDDEDIELGYEMKVFMMHQRKGIFAPHHIEKVDEKDVESILSLLSEHFKKIQNIWSPFPSLKTFNVKIQTKDTKFNTTIEGQNWLYKQFTTFTQKEAITKGSKFGIVCGVQEC
jgi:hypothetical protein